MVSMTCENHPHLLWYVKELSVSDNGRYNGQRNIHYIGTIDPASPMGHSYKEPECTCPASKLIAIDKLNNKE